jgi:hypothetical protein
MNETRQIRRYLQSSGFTTDLLVGMADGMMLPFALAVTMSLITGNAAAVLLACGIESVLLAALFGVASYQTVVNQAEEYPEQRTGGPLARKTFVSHRQLQQILSGLDLGGEVMEKAAEDGLNYQERWTGMLASYGVGLPLPDFRRARRGARNVAHTFLAGAVLPLVPYVFVAAPLQALRFSALITFAGLAVLGYAKAAYTGLTPWKGALRMMLTGMAVAAAGLLAAWLLR